MKLLRPAFLFILAFTFIDLAFAQSTDSLVDQGVQLRIDFQEITHLLTIKQITNDQYTQRYKAITQRNLDYSTAVNSLTPVQQSTLAQQVENRYAVIFPPIQQKWNAEEQRFYQEAAALSNARAKELEIDALTAAQLQTDRIFRQRQVDQKTVAPQQAATQDADDIAKIATLQDKYTSYGGGWAFRFNNQLEHLTSQLVTARDLKERLADVTTEIGKDAHRAAEIAVMIERNDLRRDFGLLDPAKDAEANAPLKAELSIIRAKYDTGGSLAASVRDFNERKYNLELQATQNNHWRQEFDAERLANKGKTVVPPIPTEQPVPSEQPRAVQPTVAVQPGQEANAPVRALGMSSGFSLLTSLFTFYILGPILSAVIAFGITGLKYVMQPKVTKTMGGYLAFSLLFFLKYWVRTLLVISLSFTYGVFIGTIVGPIAALLLFSTVTKSDDRGYLHDVLAERRKWMASLGATHTERVKMINEMFDRKDKTLSYATIDTSGGKGQIIRYRVSRNLASMETREREFLRAVELLHSVSTVSVADEKWYNWAKGGLIWGEGKANINDWYYHLTEQSGQTVAHRFKDAPSAIKWHMDLHAASVDKVVNNVLQRMERLAAKSGQHPELVPLLKSLNKRLKGGSEWLAAEDVSKTPFAKQNEYTLRIGLLDGTGQELTYSGEGSLISIAPPGSGKTQCNVFPNLLTWRGPAVVLDVKGEIYAKTSKWRAANVGPVFKFSPLDPAKSHCYNPLSFIRQEADYIWEDSRFLADMMIVPSGANDPFWENKARDVLTAAIAHVCYSNLPDERPMSRIMEIIHGGKAWDQMVVGLITTTDVRSMKQQGTSLSEMNEKTRDSVLQTAQSSLSAWGGERISRATQKSDWNPLDLRGGTNPTIYICLKPSEIDSYISLLRVFIAQHIRMLTSELPPHGVAPILFLLDELPRLKQMPPVEEAIEIGRQYGLRLWMFAQSLGQLEQAYPNAEGIVGSCAVRIFMNPSSHDGTAEKLSDELGYRESVMDGSRIKVVEAVELAGPEYKDYQIVMAASCKPVKVKKAFAWQDAELAGRMGSL